MHVPYIKNRNVLHPFLQIGLAQQLSFAPLHHADFVVSLTGVAETARRIVLIGPANCGGEVAPSFQTKLDARFPGFLQRRRVLATFRRQPFQCLFVIGRCKYQRGRRSSLTRPQGGARSDGTQRLRARRQEWQFGHKFLRADMLARVCATEVKHNHSDRCCR